MFPARIFRMCAPLIFRAQLMALLLALVPQLIRAQEATGTIVGTVTDPAGARAPGVRVTVTEIATNRSQTVISNRSGEYTAPYLAAGDYMLTAEHVGFQKSVISRLTLNVAQVVRADFRLDVGDIRNEARYEPADTG